MKKIPIRFRIKTVIEGLRKKPMTWKELAELGIPEKTLQRILQDYLISWGLVQKNKDGYYVWFEQKRELSKAEYELALQHSKNLIFGNETMLGISQYTIDSLINAYIMNPEEVIPFFNHLETGYPLIYRKFQKCLETLKERGKLIKQITKSLNKDTLRISYSFFPPIHINPSQKQEFELIEKKLQNCFKDLAGEFAIISMQVKNGIPLEGYCDFCPHRKLKIVEKP